MFHFICVVYTYYISVYGLKSYLYVLKLYCNFYMSNWETNEKIIESHKFNLHSEWLFQEQILLNLAPNNSCAVFQPYPLMSGIAEVLAISITLNLKGKQLRSGQNTAKYPKLMDLGQLGAVPFTDIGIYLKRPVNLHLGSKRHG